MSEIPRLSLQTHAPSMNENAHVRGDAWRHAALSGQDFALDDWVILSLEAGSIKRSLLIGCFSILN